MPYREFHLNSDSDARSSGSTSNEPSFDLGDTLWCDSFQLKYAAIPMTWNNMPVAGSFTIRAVDVASGLPWTWNGSLAAGQYTVATFPVALQTAIRAAVLTPGGPVMPPILLGNFIVSVFDLQGKLTFTQPIAGIPAPSSGWTITWKGQLGKIFNYSWDIIQKNQAIMPLIGGNAANAVGTSTYSLTLIPTYLFLHSNMMQGTPYYSTARPQGGFKSNTIMAKIPIKENSLWVTGYNTFANEMHESFFFSNSGSYDHLNFWFTDEEYNIIDFNGHGFSLTVALTN